MGLETGLVSLIAVGVAFVAVTLWRGRGRSVISRLLSALLGATSGVFCAFVAFALIADNVGMASKPAGVMATVAFALIAVAALAAAVYSVSRDGAV